MQTFTISLSDQVAKKVEAETKQQGFSTQAEFIKNLLQKYFAKIISAKEEVDFEIFKQKPLNEIKEEFQKIGKYNQLFINSVMKGLSESSVYAHKINK